MQTIDKPQVQLTVPSPSTRRWYQTRFLVALPLFIAYFFALSLGLPPIDDPLAFKTIADKHEFLKCASSPRVIFIGGSNLLFGLDGRRIHRELKCDVVNMGLCFYFLLPYMVREIQDDIRAGDLVVISPELDLWGNVEESTTLMNLLDPYPQAFPWILAASWDKPKLRDLLVTHLKEIARQKVVYCLVHFPSIVRGKASWHVFNPSTFLAQEIISRRYMDEHGDLTFHLTMEPVKLASNLPLPMPSKIEPRVVQLLNNFHTYCQSRGADCVVMPCPVPYEIYKRDQIKIEALYKMCSEQLAVPVLGTAREFSYPLKDFYNAYYHLHAKARQERTASVIKELKQYSEQRRLPIAAHLNSSLH